MWRTGRTGVQEDSKRGVRTEQSTGATSSRWATVILLSGLYITADICSWASLLTLCWSLCLSHSGHCCYYVNIYPMCEKVLVRPNRNYCSERPGNGLFFSFALYFVYSCINKKRSQPFDPHEFFSLCIMFFVSLRCMWCIWEALFPLILGNYVNWSIFS